MRVTVNFFKPSGKWYTSEDFEIPEGSRLGPAQLGDYLPQQRLLDMVAVTEGPTPWGYPQMRLNVTTGS